MIKLNGKEINPTIFPDGTSQVWQLDHDFNENIINTILWDFERESELIHVIQLHDLLTFGFNNHHVELIMPYLPYARQDKNVSNGETFALYSFTRILRSCKFKKIVSYDAHSNSAFNCLDNFVNIAPNLSFTKDYGLVCFPDKGAMDRYSDLVDKPAFYAEKVRDQKTGWITHYDIVSELHPIDYDIIVVGDLCDGGMTFNILADKLHEIGVGKLDLYVTHGLFSKGIGELLKNYNRIITTDTRFSNINLDHEAVQSNQWRLIRDSVKDGRLIIKDHFGTV
jgi:phosphoribosylpyrophosphate synthetase